MRLRMFVFCACAALAPLAACAHGPQIQITDTNDKIVTRTLLPNAPYGDSLTAAKLVYVLPILQASSGSPTTDYWTVMPNSSIDPILGSTQFQFGPGFAYGYGHTFADGAHFNVNFVSPLQRWNGTAFVNDSGPEAVGAFRGDATAPADQLVISGSSNGSQSLPFSNISSTYDSDSHSSMRFRMLGDGFNALIAPPAGLYLLTLQIASTQSGLAASDPISFLLYKNFDTGQIASAVASLNINPALVQFLSVPEPCGVALAAIGVIGATTIRSRRHSKGGVR
jgi:hypothetical protein